MGAKHVSPEEIVKMITLYQTLGTYEAVGREIGRSGTTVSRYVQMKDVPQNIQLMVQNIINNGK